MPPFRFKQFAVAQDRCAMKVCTDACAFGAWVGEQAPAHTARALDIGTGTGLLALMLAQCLPQAHIVGVELDPEACAQARENMGNSPWASRLQAVEMSIQAYAQSQPAGGFGLVAANPPFFPEHLQPGDPKRRQALHTTALPFGELAAAIGHLLAPEGEAWILLPPAQQAQFGALAREQGLFPRQACLLHDRPGTRPLRSMACYRREALENPPPSALFIREGNAYSEPFQRLLRPFYLFL
jgi:tRNA1Val (adenine37-N6)-methyltransferase